MKPIKIKNIWPVLLIAGAMGCSKSGNTNAVPPDNSEINERDKNQHSITPYQQKENDVDLTITQKIRQAIVAETTFSTNAKNVKIITINKQVTLRGPVGSQAEKDKIGELAAKMTGVTRVDNQLEVKNE